MNEAIRALFPITKEYAYLNHAAVSAPPMPVVDRVMSQLADVQHHGVNHFRSWIATKERARQGIAGLLNARPNQVAFMRNTSDAISTIANGFKWTSGDNIVTYRHEFPSNIYPWLRIRDQFGVEIRMCEERDGRIEFEELAGLIDSSTRIVAISSVQYASGFRIDLERLSKVCRRVGALLVVDSIQSLGVMQIDVQAEGVDVAAGACHKWLLAPEGIGYIYLSDRARELIQPTMVGWISVPDPEDYYNFDQEWKDGALAWETGTGSTALFYGLEAALEILNKVGVESIQRYLLALTDELCDALAEKGYRVESSRRPSEKSQIVCIAPGDGSSAMSLYSHLKAQKVITAPRGGRIRISPHFYNDRSDIDRLLRALP